MKKFLAVLLFAVAIATTFAPSQSLAFSNTHSIFSFKLADAASDAAKACREKGGVPTSGVLGAGRCVGGEQGGSYQNPIFAMTSIIITIAISFMGLAMVGLLVFAGIRYITSGGSPDDVKAAKGMISSVLTALVLFAIMGAVLTLILPTGFNPFQ